MTGIHVHACRAERARGMVADPHRALASAVIMSAIHEKRNNRTQYLSFMRSEWFDMLAEIAGIDPDVAREKLGIPEPKRIRKGGTK
jgi:hypothetical protein